ncbi:MAG: hypothetical protein U9Q03_02925 [Patescibacteria group bacterium]|nr:hypothetical protein [Patescibacteria group bacterium]
MGRNLIFDIETVGEKFDAMDEVTQRELTKRALHGVTAQEDRDRIIAEVADGLALSPLTGEIVALGLMDADIGDGVVYYQSPGVDQSEIAEQGVRLIALSEEAMLRRFWDDIGDADALIGFNSRPFDAFWIMIRSAKYRIRAKADLLSGRYLYQQKRRPIHIDLLDQLTGYGATRTRGSLHMWCRLAGIKSPKGGEVSGNTVGEAFALQKFLKIAQYNIDDLVAQRELYLWWRDYINHQQM